MKKIPAPPVPYEEPAEDMQPKPDAKPAEKKNPGEDVKKGERPVAKVETAAGQREKVVESSATTKPGDIPKLSQGIAESIGWTKLSPETRTTILAVAGAVGVSALVHYMVKFFRGTKKAVDTGLQKARSGLQTAIGWGALALTGTLAFFGIRYVNRIGSSIEEAKKLARAAEEKGQKIAEEGKKKLEEVQAKAVKAEQAAKANAQKLEETVQTQVRAQEQEKEKQSTAAKAVSVFASATATELQKSYGDMGYAFSAENGAVMIRRPKTEENQAPVSLSVVTNVNGAKVLKDHPDIILRETKDVVSALRAQYGLDLDYEHAKYLVERAKGSALPSMAARMIVSFEQHPEVQWPENESPKNQREKIVTVINQLMLREDVTMEQIFSCVPAGKLNRMLLEKLYEPPADSTPEQRDRYLLAAELVVRSCVRHKQEIQRGYLASGEQEKGLWERITFRQFMGEFGHAFEAFEKLQHQIVEEKRIDPSAWDFDSVANSVGKGKGQAAELTKLFLAEDEFSAWKGKERELQGILEDVSYAKILEYLQKKEISPEVTVNGFENLIKTNKPLADDDVLGRALLAFCRHLPTPEQMEPFFHKVFPTAEYSLEDRDANIAVIRAYLKDTMPMHQAVRFFMYQRMIEKGNPAGVVLMQAEVFRFIRQKEQGMLGEDYLKTRAHEAVQNLAKSVVAEDFFPELRKHFPSLDARMQLQLQDTLERFGPSAFRTAAAAFLGPAFIAAEPAIAFVKRNKEPVAAIGGTVGSGTLWWKYRNFKLSRSSPQAVVRAVESRAGIDSLGARMRAFLKLRIHPEAYAQLHHQLAGFVPKIVELRAIDGTIGEPLYAQLTRVFSNGSSQAELKNLHASVASQAATVKTRVSTLKALKSPTGVQVQELARCEKALEQLHSARDSLFTLANSTEKAAVEARNALRVFTSPIPTRIARFGPAVVHELLNLYTAAAENGPEFLELWKDVNLADLENKDALEGVLRTQRAGKAAEIAMRVSSGPLFYLMYARMGMGPAAVVSLGAEGLISEAKFISGKIRENVEDIEASGDERTRQAFQGKLSTKETEAKLTEYGSQSRTTAQHLRFWSASNFVTFDPKTWSFGEGDSDAEMTRERKLVRENYFSGYLMHRLLEKVDARDPFAAQFLGQLYDHDGRESPKHNLLWGTYLQDCRHYLKEKTGSSDDLTLISKKMPLEAALQGAEHYAIFQMEIREYQSSFGNIQLLEPQMLSASEELEKLNTQLKNGTLELVEYEKQAKPVQEKLAALTVDFEHNASMLSAFERFTISSKDGKQLSLSDIALDAEGRPRIQHGKEGIALSEAYRDKKEELLRQAKMTPEEFRAVLNECKRVLGALDAITNIPNRETYATMTQYGNFLDQHPAFDPTGSVRHTLRNMPGLYWTRTLPDTGVPGGHPYWKQFEQARETVRGQMRWISSQEKRVTPFNRGFAESIELNVGYEDLVFSMESTKEQKELARAIQKFGLVPASESVGYTRPGYAGKYFAQVDGTLYWTGGKGPSGTIQSPKTYIPALDRWVVREAMQQIPSRDLQGTFVAIVQGKEYTALEGVNSLETPLGTFVRKTEAGVSAGTVENWYLQGVKSGNAYLFMRNHLGIEQSGRELRLEQIPDLVLHLRPEGQQYFYPLTMADITVVLKDGTQITASTYQKGGVEKLAKYLSLKKGYISDYRRMEFEKGSWVEQKKERAEGYQITILPAYRNQIAEIVFTSPFSRYQGQQTRLRVSPESSAPESSHKAA